MLGEAQADRGEALQVEILHVRRGWLQDYLQLVVLKKSVGVLAVATVGGPTRRLHVSYLVAPGTQDSEERFRVHRSRSNFDVVGLLNDAPIIASVTLKLKDEVLKSWTC